MPFSIAPLVRPFFFFFFNDTATTEIYTLSLHDALPISLWPPNRVVAITGSPTRRAVTPDPTASTMPATSYPTVQGSLGDRKSTRLNSSHGYISYAVFCLKKKKQKSNL